MEELLRGSFFLYLFAAAFVGLLIFFTIFNTVKKTKNIINLKIRTFLIVGVCAVLICLWVVFFGWQQLYPISLAYYEYNKGITNEATGVIEGIEQQSKDRICINVNNTNYILVYSSINPPIDINQDITEGDEVKIIFGKQSLFIFDICKLND